METLLLFVSPLLTKDCPTHIVSFENIVTRFIDFFFHNSHTYSRLSHIFVQNSTKYKDNLIYSMDMFIIVHLLIF